MISLICKQYGIENYTINSDGSIDVNGNVSLSWLSITELPLRFNKITGYFDCSNNKLTSLKGSPKRVDRYFDCSYNRLSSLEFSPDYVGKYFNCDDNKLTNNYCDSEIGGSFYTTLKQDGLMSSGYGIPTNYNEWRKLYKRKMILDDIFNM
jgi:hypothetical protein